MNLQPTRKYGVPPEEVEKKSSESEENRLTYDFSRLKKVDKDAERYSRYNRKSDKKAIKTTTFTASRRRTSLSLVL